MPASSSVPGCMGALGDAGLPACLRPPIHHDFFMSCFWSGSTVAKSERSVGAPAATWLTNAQRERHRRMTTQFSCRCEPARARR